MRRILGRVEMGWRGRASAAILDNTHEAHLAGHRRCAAQRLAPSIPLHPRLPHAVGGGVAGRCMAPPHRPATHHLRHLHAGHLPPSTALPLPAAPSTSFRFESPAKCNRSSAVSCAPRPIITGRGFETPFCHRRPEPQMGTAPSSASLCSTCPFRLPGPFLLH